jgi:hypothetical protein
LWKEAIPLGSGKFRVSDAQGSDEMAFEGLNGTFSSVTTMKVWWNQLVLDFVLKESLFQSMGGLIIHDVEGWGMARGSKGLKQGHDGIF